MPFGTAEIDRLPFSCDTRDDGPTPADGKGSIRTGVTADTGGSVRVDAEGRPKRSLAPRRPPLGPLSG